MFLGTYNPRMDDKGRIALPARYRTELEGVIVICRGQEHCLNVYAYEEFKTMTEALRTVPITSAKGRDYHRMLYSGASEEKTDSQGRVTIPPALRQYAGLTKDCTVIGADTRVEIWDTAAWERYAEAKEAAFADIAEELVPGTS